MTANNLKEVLRADCTVTIVEEGIYSVLRDPAKRHQYDGRAAVYDAAVNSRLYNRLAWGSTPRDYVSFAQEAITLPAAGKLLDAGCGSLIFTAPSYLESSRQIVAFDESLAMLRRARRRLIELAGAVPENVVLLQGDVTDLPFQPKSFQGVLCMNVLHHIEEAVTLISNLNELLTGEQRLNLTSLVSNHRLAGDLYLRFLHASGEFAHPRSHEELREMLVHTFGEKITYRVKGNMAFASA